MSMAGTSDGAVESACVETQEMYRAVCSPCGLMDGSWSSPWMMSKRTAERMVRLHDEFMGHRGQSSGEGPDESPVLVPIEEEDAVCEDLMVVIDRLTAENEKLDRAVTEEIDNRDRYMELLDQFAYAVAPQTVIGEHSLMNDPWANALQILLDHGPLAGAGQDGVTE